MHFSKLRKKITAGERCVTSLLLGDVMFCVEPCGDLQAVTESSCAEN